MCYVLTTATYKDVFEILENNSSILISNLPEITIGEKIYKCRMYKGITQREFAKKCGIGYSSLCKYETGYSTPDNLNIKNINKIIDTFLNY